MPDGMWKTCSYPGCTELTRGGRCARHKKPEYQDFQRDPERQRLYGTAHWKRIRKAQLSAHPWCEYCLAAGRYTPATDVDHEERHEGDPEKFFSGPFQSLCHACHSRKTAQEVGFSSQGEGGQKSFDLGGTQRRGRFACEKVPDQNLIKRSF